MTASQPALAPSPLPEERKALLARVVDGLDGASLWWLSGYAAGLAQVQPATQAPRAGHALPIAAAAPGQRLTVVYGSQTGNAKRVAEKLAQDAEAAAEYLSRLQSEGRYSRDVY